MEPTTTKDSEQSNIVTEQSSRQRKLSNQGKDLLRTGLDSIGKNNTSSETSTIFEQEAAIEKIRARASGDARFTLAVPLHNNDSVIRTNRSDSEDEEDLQGQPVLGYAPSFESSMEIVTTEKPLRGLQIPLHNPVDQSQIVPSSDRTFTNEPYICTHVWRDDTTESITKSENAMASSSSPVDAIRRSISISRRSLHNAAGALSVLGMAESSDPQTGISATVASPTSRRMSEKRLTTAYEVERGSEKAVDLAMRGLGSDYTLFNRDWSVLLRAKRSNTRWNQLHHRYKHSDLVFFVGALSDVPIATLKSGARASRLLLLERHTDGGIVYTMAKEKIGSHRVFWIMEGRRPSGIVEPTQCRFVLIVRNGRAVIKCRDESSLLVPHLSSSRASASSLSASFNTTVLDFIDKGNQSIVKIASGMDVVLAFACLAVADRFISFKSFIADDKTRSEVLNGRFETGIGDSDLDVFQSVSAQKLNYGTTSAANSLMY